MLLGARELKERVVLRCYIKVAPSPRDPGGPILEDDVVPPVLVELVVVAHRPVFERFRAYPVIALDAIAVKIRRRLVGTFVGVSSQEIGRDSAHAGVELTAINVVSWLGEINPVVAAAFPNEVEVAGFALKGRSGIGKRETVLLVGHPLSLESIG